MTASGGRSAAARAPPQRSRPCHLVARAAQLRLQRSQDLRLVVDDEDRAAPLTAGLDGPGGGKASMKRAPLPAARSARAGRRSPRRSRGRSRARVRCRAPAGPGLASNGSKIRLVSPRDARPASRTSSSASPPACARRRPTVADAQRVLDQVDQHAFDLGSVDPDRGILGELDAIPRGPRLDRSRDDLGERAAPPLGSSTPASSRERSSRFPTIRSSLIVSASTVSSWRRRSSRVEVNLRGRETLRRDADRGQRRAQVVAHRIAGSWS